MKPRILIFAFVMAAGVVRPVSAQIPVGTKVGEPTTSGYDSGGRRDPFMSLIVPKRPVAGPGGIVGRALSGLTSISISDVTVTGIVTVGNQKMCLLQGADRQSYVAKVGARIMDATIKSIDAQGVVFVEQTEPGSTARPQETRKTLRPAAEVIR